MSDIEVRRVPNGETMYITERGIMHFESFPRGVIRQTFIGQGTAPMAAKIIESGERDLAEHRRCVYMVDNWDGTMMTTEFREAMTAWVAENTSRVSVHMLFRSKMFEMGLSIASLIMGRNVTHAYSDVEEWESVGRKFSGSPTFGRVPIEVPADLRDRFTRPSSLRRSRG